MRWRCGAIWARERPPWRAPSCGRWGSTEDVPSPTFTLVQSYDTFPPVAHFDLYRLKSAREMQELGFDDALDNGAVLVEWPERAPEALPPDALHVRLGLRDGARLARLTGPARWENLIHV